MSKVENGLYNSAGEVVQKDRWLLRHFDEVREKKVELRRAEIQAGIDDLAAGWSRDGRQVMEDICLRLQFRLGDHGNLL